MISPSFSHPRAQRIADKFTAQNITDVKVLWEPGSEFKNLLADAEFNLVASRSAQAAVIKAIKAGKANVDLSTPTTLLVTVQMVAALTQAATIRATQDRNLEDHSSNRYQRSYGVCHLAWNFELYGIA